VNDPVVEVPATASLQDRYAIRRRSATRPPVWDVALTIAVGGALGAIARYAVSTAWPHPPGGFPWTTFAINVTGCLLIGALMVVLTELAGHPHRLIRPFLGVGILGGFTTFSTYTVDTQQLISAGNPGLALGYLFGTLAAALVAVQVGVVAARLLTRLPTRRRPRRGRA
jgi:CrcB protein